MGLLHCGRLNNKVHYQSKECSEKGDKCLECCFDVHLSDLLCLVHEIVSQLKRERFEACFVLSLKGILSDNVSVAGRTIDFGHRLRSRRVFGIRLGSVGHVNFI